jgi:hypothetical protein
MVYGAEAVLPPEVTMGSLRVKIYDEATDGNKSLYLVFVGVVFSHHLGLFYDSRTTAS